MKHDLHSSILLGGKKISTKKFMKTKHLNWRQNPFCSFIWNCRHYHIRLFSNLTFAAIRKHLNLKNPIQGLIRLKIQRLNQFWKAFLHKLWCAAELSNASRWIYRFCVQFKKKMKFSPLVTAITLKYIYVLRNIQCIIKNMKRFVCLFSL